MPQFKQMDRSHLIGCSRQLHRPGKYQSLALMGQLWPRLIQRQNVFLVQRCVVGLDLENMFNSMLGVMKGRRRKREERNRNKMG